MQSICFRVAARSKSRSGHVPGRDPLCLLVIILLALCATTAESQAPAVTNNQEALGRQLQALSDAVSGMQQQLSQSQEQVETLKLQVQALQAQLRNAHAADGASITSSASSSEDTAASLNRAVADLKEQDEVLQSEVAVHEQTKLESASKYPIKVTGLLLFSSFMNNENVDSIDDPVLALPRVSGATHGSLSATARQSILGLDATGPQLWNARSSADVNIDFFGGLGYSDYSTSAGIVRLRTAHARLDWQRHSLIAEVDTPIISPISPTSLLAQGEPALAWSGNLWSWAPQLELKSKTAMAKGMLHYDFALMDPPAAGPPSSAAVRQADAAEQSRQPGYELRTSYSIGAPGHSLDIGAGGYYSRQAYTGTQHVDSWAATADWMIPIAQHIELSGEFYRGRALGGLGGGAFKDISTDAAGKSIRGVEAAGGWSQLKFRFPADLEANIAFGQDSAYRESLYYQDGTSSDPYGGLARNRATTGNLIFRPKTYLLFSTEFRYLQSWPARGAVSTAPIVGFGLGYLF